MDAYTDEQMAIFRDPDTAHWEDMDLWFGFEAAGRAAGWTSISEHATNTYPGFFNAGLAISWYPDGMDARKRTGIPSTRDPDFVTVHDWAQLCKSLAIVPTVCADIPKPLVRIAQHMVDTGAWRQA